MMADLKTVSGRFFRIVFEHQSENVLRGAISPQGRYHHDAQPSLYMSSRPDWAQKAVESYVHPGDAVRVIHRLEVGEARVVDTRERALCLTLGIDPADSDVQWLPQLEAGIRPSTWNVSDAARRAGADGLIYTARSNPMRWHLVLFKWNNRAALSFRGLFSR